MLNSKTTQNGTYDVNVNRIGDCILCLKTLIEI
ncbi:toxin C-terminal domain-containing protein [Acinetobacter baumannii]